MVYKQCSVSIDLLYYENFSFQNSVIVHSRGIKFFSLRHSYFNTSKEPLNITDNKPKEKRNFTRSSRRK